MSRLFLFFTFTILSILSLNSQIALSSPLDDHGQLSIKGSQIIDEKGLSVDLRGVSSHGLQWFGKDITRERLQDLRDGWGIKVFRIAMYTDQGGYISNRSLKNKVTQVADWAIELGIYFIIDWHILFDGNPQKYQKESIEFFKEMATRYRSHPNTIYEICNEPNGNVSWHGNIKPYAEALVKTIRDIDDKNLIIIGSGNWSQNIHDPANDPVRGSNLIYAVHFYAGTHGDWLMKRIDYALSKGIPVFASEWAMTNSTGGGSLFYRESNVWMSFLKLRSIGWTAWSYSTAGESSALLRGNGLSESGKYVKGKVAE